MSSQIWNEGREELKMIMKNEIGVMREMLSNMHQEELNLMLNDNNGVSILRSRRIEIANRLSSLKESRINTFKKLEGILPSSKKMDQVLALDDESYSEMRLLQDQFQALEARIEFQAQRNQGLSGRMDSNSQSIYHAAKKKTMTLTCEE